MLKSEDFKKQHEYYFTYDKPIPYKHLMIYPVKMSKYFEFFASIDCVRIKKNNIPDPHIISMSYLDFLFFLMENDKEGIYESKLCEILSLSLHIDYDKILYLEKYNKKILFLDGEPVGKKDFDDIRRIICYQNLPNFDDTYIDPELEHVLEETRRLNSQNNGEITSLEYQILCITTSTSLTVEQIENMSIRKFILLLGIVDSKLHYQIYKTGECSGMVSFKEPITHWMHYKNNKFDGLLKYNAFKDKMKHVI